MQGKTLMLYFHEGILIMSALDLSDFLEVRAKELGLSAMTIANTAGLSRQTWYRLLNADIKQARIETLVRIAEVLQVSLIELSTLYMKKQPAYPKTFGGMTCGNDACSFIRDVNYPLNAMVKRQQVFEKKWEVINIGSTSWVNRRLVCVDDEFDIQLKERNNGLPIRQQTSRLQPRYDSIDVPLTAPREHLILSTSFYAPQDVGTVISFWKMIDAEGQYCFPEDAGLSCQVRVVNGEDIATTATIAMNTLDQVA